MSQRPVERPRHPCEVQRIDEQPCVPDLPTAAAAFERDGELWERATWATIAGWIGLLVTRVIIIAAATIVGATLAASASSTPLMLAVTLATQMIVVVSARRKPVWPSPHVRDTGGSVAPVDELSSTLGA
jgi:hypothetical protein